MDQYKLPSYDAELLTSDRGLADYFEDCTLQFAQPKKFSNWVLGSCLELFTA